MRPFGPNSDNSGEGESKVGVELKGGFIFQGEGITVSKALSFQRVVTPRYNDLHSLRESGLRAQSACIHLHWSYFF